MSFPNTVYRPVSEGGIGMRRRRWPRRSLLIGCVVALALSGMGAITLSQWESASDAQLQELKTQTTGVITQTSEALTYVLFAWDALHRDDTEGGVTNAHRAINVLEGPNGDNYDGSYGDADDGVGNGVGALVHAQQTREIIDGMSQGTDYQMAAENVDLFLQWADGNLLKALEDIDAGDADAASRHLRQSLAMLMAARGSREEVDRPTQGSARAILEWLENIE